MTTRDLSKPSTSEELEALLHKVYLHDVHPDEAKATIARFIVTLSEAVRDDEREACAKLADIEKNACESHLRACKLMRRKGVNHAAGAQIARDIASYIRRRGAPTLRVGTPQESK